MFLFCMMSYSDMDPVVFRSVLDIFLDTRLAPDLVGEGGQVWVGFQCAWEVLFHQFRDSEKVDVSPGGLKTNEMMYLTY